MRLLTGASNGGYRHESIRRRLHGAAQCITWAQTSGCDLPSLAPAPLEHLRCHLSKQSQRGLSQGQHSVRWLGAQRFFACLQPQQILASADTATEAMSPELLREFEPWMQRHRGVQCATLLPYRPHVMALLTDLGMSPERFEAAQLRTHLPAHAQSRSTTVVKTRVTATRLFRRFLTATACGPPGLEATLPAMAQWRLSTLPRYVTPENMARVIAACESATSRDIRDTAIVLL
jgi:hypothetical protein